MANFQSVVRVVLQNDGTFVPKHWNARKGVFEEIDPKVAFCLLQQTGTSVEVAVTHPREPFAFMEGVGLMKPVI